MKHAVQGLRLDGANWVFSYRMAGRAKRMTIGKFPAVSPKDASKGASILAGQICCGRDPSAEKKAGRIAARVASAPVHDIIEPVLKRYLRHAKARTRASTFTETSRVFRVEVLPKWEGRRLSEISRADVRQLIAAIAARPAPISANRCLASLKTFFAWCVGEDILTVSPAASVRPPSHESPRERCLDDSELSAVWNASLGLGEYGAGVRLLALTGARRSEVFGMTWQEIDVVAKTWTLPAARAKNGRQHSVPLSEQAIEILRWLAPGLGELSGPVFEPVSFSRGKAELDKLLPGVAAFTLHDLRRTFASGCARLGVRIETVERALNHSSGSFRGIVGVYQKYDFASEKRAALDLWAAHIAALPVCPVVLSKAA